jgi:hypothetical protein
MTARPMTSVGMTGDRSAVGRRPCRALSGGSPDGRAADAGRATPLPQAGTSRNADPRHRGCKAQGWPVLRARHPLAGQDHSQGRSLRSRLPTAHRPRRP